MTSVPKTRFRREVLLKDASYFDTLSALVTEANIFCVKP